MLRWGGVGCQNVVIVLWCREEALLQAHVLHVKLPLLAHPHEQTREHDLQ